MSYLDDFESINLERIEELVSTGEEENLQLEFKAINDPSLNSDDKRNLAKALSGFSNSNGGIIVWGIDARKNPKGIDCACDKKEIRQLSLFISRLNELTGRAVTPIVEGVKHKKIASVDDRGFGVTLVLESDSGPHMAKLGEDRYYKRSGDSFYRMEHFDLEDMFGRRKKPKLNLTVRQVDIGRKTLILGIANIGRATAKAPFLAFKIPAPFRLADFGLDGNMHDGLPRLHGPGQEVIRYGADSNFVIHPDTTLEVAAIDVGYPPPPNLPAQLLISVEYELAAEDFALVRDHLQIHVV